MKVFRFIGVIAMLMGAVTCILGYVDYKMGGLVVDADALAIIDTAMLFLIAGFVLIKSKF